jgi:hypothetical protein
MKKLFGVLMLLLIMVTSCVKEPSTLGTVNVTNYTGYTIVVDVNDGSGDWLGEKTVYNNGSVSYTAQEGDIDCSARFADDNYWYYAETLFLTAGSTIEFEWTYEKSATINEKSTKISNCGIGSGTGSLIKISRK